MLLRIDFNDSKPEFQAKLKEIEDLHLKLDKAIFELREMNKIPEGVVSVAEAQAISGAAYDALHKADS